MPLPVARLNSADLPVSFKYIPYVPKKRNSVHKTANSVITQAAYPTQIVHGDGILPWTIEDARPEEFEDLYALYNTAALTLYEFEGYWNDILEVYFTVLKVDRVFGRFMALSGEFQVVAIEEYTHHVGLSCAY